MLEVIGNASFNQHKAHTAEAIGAKEAAGRVCCAGYGAGSTVTHAGAQ